MKRIRKEFLILFVLFVVFPLIYIGQEILSPKPGTGEDLVPQTNLHFALTEQRIEGDDLIITVRNTGESSWTEKDWIRAMLYNDGQDTGIRAHMKPGKTVKVGDTVTFTFTDIRQSLTPVTEVSMVQETVAYFPERKPVIVE